MNQYIKSALRRSPRITIILGLVLFVGSQAWADVLGRLHFSVKNAADEKPVAGAKITLKDSANVRPPIVLKTDDKGNVTTDPIDARAWHITTEADTFHADERDVTVVADTTTEVEVLVEPLKETTIVVKGQKNVVNGSDTSQGVKRDPGTFNQKFPTNPGNRQSLNETLRANPGLAQDSVNQLHPRGEHSSTTIYVNGFQIPGAFQGRFGQILSPSAIQSLDLMTGGYAPEYGRETAAILNVELRAGTISPFVNYSLSGGTFNTLDGGITFGGQLGQSYGEANDQGVKAKRFGYLIDLNARTTANALEPPQPDDQTAHNHGQGYTSFGNFDYHISSRDSLSLMLSGNPANTQVANRTGLPDFYAPFGQGYGYGGAQGPSSGLLTQQQDGQDVFQRDRNEFGILNYLRRIDDKTQARFAFGLTHNGLDILNHNPAIDLNNLPSDNSIEFNPSISRNARDAQFQGSVTRTEVGHTIKFGFSVDRETANESYSLDPASQMALNTLLSGDPNNPVEDPNNPLWLLRPDGSTPSTVRVSRKGWYNAAYVQDTWRINPKFTANYGVRLDQYIADQTTVRNAEDPIQANTSLTMLSPRINLAYAITPKTVARASYNRLMITPPGAQGAAVGAVVPPEKLNQYEVSVEQQTGPGQSAKVSAYYKDIRDQLDTGLLVPGTQMGVFVTDSIPKDSVRGLEVSYNLFPNQPFGFNGYLSYAYAIAKPQGVGDPYNDHDQLHTLSLGLNYKLPKGEEIGAVYNYGSGFFSSTLEDGGVRHPHHSLNLRFAKPNLFGGVGLALDVENAFDDRDLLNFNSAFSGTRFQQGRRILLTANGKF
ncbi:MAG TPA: TonB-dependent receptor [Fimbriimonadaceae bacterium]|nr:TonB-dependent receptor [Fimbriimonadaceae bacterium]